MKTRIAFLAITLCLPAFNVSADNPIDPRVTDGDSLKLNGVRIRLSRIDAVEHDQVCYEDTLKQRPWECGKAATRFVSDIVRRHGVTCNDEGRDYYGRTLATCHAGETNLNAEIVRMGFAVTMGKDGYWREWDHAKRHRLGIHKGPFVKPRQWRKARKEAD